MNKKQHTNFIAWVFGTAVFVDGLLNLFFGNDFGLGVAFLLLSFIYFPPFNTFFKRKVNFSIPLILKIIIALLICWITLAVGAISEGSVF